MTPNYQVGDVVVIQNGTTFILGKIEGVLEKLSPMGRALYETTTGFDLYMKKKNFEVPEEMIVCLEKNMITCDI